MDYSFRSEFGDRESGYKSALTSGNSTNKIKARTTFEYDVQPSATTNFSGGAQPSATTNFSGGTQPSATANFSGGEFARGGRGEYSVGYAGVTEYGDEEAERVDKQRRQAEGVRVLYAPIIKTNETAANAGGAQTAGNAVQAGDAVNIPDRGENRGAGIFDAGQNGANQNDFQQTRGRPESYVDFALRNKNFESRTRNANTANGGLYVSAPNNSVPSGGAYVNNPAQNAGAYVNNSVPSGGAYQNGGAYVNNPAQNAGAYVNNSVPSGGAYGTSALNAEAGFGVNVSRAQNGASPAERLFYGSGSSSDGFFENAVSTVRSDFDRRQELNKLLREHEEKRAALDSYDDKVKYIYETVKNNRNGEILNVGTDGIEPRFERDFSYSAEGFAGVDTDSVYGGFDDGAKVVEISSGADSIRVVEPSNFRRVRQVEKRGADFYDIDGEFNGAYEGRSKTEGGKSGFFRSLFKKKDGTGRATGLTGLGKFVVCVYVALAAALAVFIISNQSGTGGAPVDSSQPAAVEIESVSDK
ncbi:MAG: hypothetical protein LBP62_08310 [Clostridiales bacterium]|jgi:hypothetical protein|nr:hypothetical protein [Clostridiales bacterium]